MKRNDFNYFESLTNNSLFAVLDIETTGFSPQRGDKIVEIAIVTTDVQGNIVDKYETLVNPNRDVSATHIHKITADMVKNAPYIEDIMEDIIYHLNNKTIVGHNIEFDLRFINHEISKYLKKDIVIRGLCTLLLSRHLVPDLPARRLDAICEYYDIQEPEAHSAIGDCESTLELFNIFKSALIENVGFEEFIQNFTYPVHFNNNIRPKNISFKRKDAFESIKLEANRLFNLIKRLPSNPTDSLPIQKYLNLLDEILADRIITEAETEILMDFIDEFSISQNQVIDIHNEYLRKLTRVYLLDNYLSDSEYSDLLKVSNLLCIRQDKLDKTIDFEKAKIAKQQVAIEITEQPNYIGKSICFTGQLISKLEGNLIDRSLAQQLAMERGLIIKSGVSNKLDFLITADPNSLSSKAMKAKELGIKVIAEPVFWNMIGVAIE